MKKQMNITRIFLYLLLITLLNNYSFSQQDVPQVEVLIPLYIFPYADDGAFDWQPILDAQSKVKISAIINPDSGPSNNSWTKQKFTQGIKKLNEANVKVYGYISTGYIDYQSYKGGGITTDTNSTIAAIKAEIALYRSQTRENNSYTLDGIFFDEVGGNLSIYKDLYNYIKNPNTGNASWEVILNPGQPTNPDYLNPSGRAGDIMVTFENDFSVFGNLSINSSNPEKYSLMVYSNMNPSVRTSDFKYVNIRAKEHKFKYVYVTDDVYYKAVNEGTIEKPVWVTRDHNGKILTLEEMKKNNPYNQLPSFWWPFINYIQWNNHPIKAHYLKNALIYNRWRNEKDANLMSKSDRRNTIIVEMNLHSNQSISYFQSLGNHDLTSVAAIVGALIQKHGFTKSELAKKSTKDHRNLLIRTLNNKGKGKSMSTLGSMDAFQLAAE